MSCFIRKRGFLWCWWRRVLSLPLSLPNYTRRKEIHTREQQCHAVPIWTNRMVPCQLYLVFHAVIWLVTQWYSITWIWDDWTTTLFWVNTCHSSPLHCQVPSAQTMYMSLTTYHPNMGLDPPYPTKHTHHNHITLTNSYWDKSLILVHQSAVFNDNLHLSPLFFRSFSWLSDIEFLIFLSSFFFSSLIVVPCHPIASLFLLIRLPLVSSITSLFIPVLALNPSSFSSFCFSVSVRVCLSIFRSRIISGSMSKYIWMYV